MANKDTKKFLLKIFLFFSPLYLILISYFIFDPFKVLYEYDNFYNDYFIEPNRDYVSTEIFLKNREKQKYNSFIFGSSRSLAFRTKEWEKYLIDARPFHFDSYAESIYGIWSKIKLIDRINDPIKNSLIVIDESVFGHFLLRLADLNQTEDNNYYLFTKHPIYSNKSKFKFHMTFLKAYFTKRFFICYLDYKFFRKKSNYMNGVIDFQIKKATPIRNDFYLIMLDILISKFPLKYYELKSFPSRPIKPKISRPKIQEKELSMLREISSIFQKHCTNYKIIISPLYNQIIFNRNDLKLLQKIFGKENVYDFSGVNQFTVNIRNYYDTRHYRPIIGKQILKQIYNEKSDS